MASPQPQGRGEKGNGTRYMGWRVQTVLCVKLKLPRAWGALQAPVTPHERLTTKSSYSSYGQQGLSMTSMTSMP